MKYAYLLILAVVISSCAGPLQTAGIADANAPSESNTITVHTSMDADEAYRKAAQILQDRGYSFRSTDASLRSISTEFTGVAKRWGVDYTFVRIGANVKNEKNALIVIRGWGRTLENENDDVGWRVKKSGQSSYWRNTWAELHEVASSIGDSLSYSVQ